MSRMLLVAAGAVALIASHPFATPLPSRVSHVQTDREHVRHHYSIAAKIRPLLVFWIGRSGVGDAVISAHETPGASRYSLLIGSDPLRAPRSINRWGYISEDIQGPQATLIGLMTTSDEESLQEAEANTGRPGAGEQAFKVIRASVDAGVAKSVVTAMSAPASYSYRQVDTLLGRVPRTPLDASGNAVRITRLPAGTQPGFLSAVATLMHRQVAQWQGSRRVSFKGPLPFVYHGKLYELRVKQTRTLDRVRVGNTSYDHVISSDLELVSQNDGETTAFTMVYGADGDLAEIPITASFQPRWWMQIDLALDDSATGTALVEGLNQ